MCLFAFGACVQVFYYLLLFLVPVFGSFCGKGVVLRFSLMLCLQAVLSSAFNGFNHDRDFLGPILFLGSLFTSALLPFTLLPSWIIDFYDVFLWSSEPLWLLSESIGLLHLSVQISREIADHKDDQPQLAQIVSTTISVIALSVSAFFIKQCSDDYVYLGIIAITVAIYCILYTFMRNEDYVHPTDMAILLFCSSVYMYGSYRESHVAQWSLKVPPEWVDFGEKSSLSQILLQVVKSTLDGMFNILSYLQRIFTPWTVLSGALRIFGIMYGITLLKQHFYLDEDTEDDSSSLFSHWRSPLIIKLSSIFMYTQFVLYQIHRTAFSEVGLWSWCFSHLHWMQFAAVNVLYAYFLCIQASDSVC
ncbi:hypothetical protein CAPTEDRAFT_204367 [Capitella teleta]|uniref:Uncharacterized protein n=1 Tax=Capitella teleta TaxID=283909 RepID=R7TYQ6_CAPTE|nr:hypothetical protein CAPTEDRAFT_204367 [Capitella teleta]|eukprot:ELT98757.1 hypothetical protein CAPTEDRAFT_204367 [Capitella teleta]